MSDFKNDERENHYRKIISLSILALLFVGGTATFAVIIWDSLKLPGSVTIDPEDTHLTQWSSDVTAFNFENIKPDEVSGWIPVHIENISTQSATLNVGFEILNPDLILKVCFLDSTPYTPQIVNNGEGIDLLLAVESSPTVPTGIIDFNIVFTG